MNDKKTVHSAFVRFPGLLHDLRLSPLKSEVLAVNLEVDTNPPAGATLATTIVRRHLTLQIQHHDRASLLAGKLHAISQRPHVKGRDAYDLLWYLSDPDWSPPNLTMLNYALHQMNWQGTPLTQETWRNAVRARLEIVTWDHIIEDVCPFLEASTDPNLLTRENILHVLGS